MENERLVWKGIRFSAFHRDVMLPSGEMKVYEHVWRKDGTRTIALQWINDELHVLLTREERDELNNAEDWRVPGGRFLTASEPSLHAAKREFREETGYVASQWHYLWHTTSQSTVRFKRHYFLALGLDFVGQELDETEKINVHWIKLSIAKSLAMRIEGLLPIGSNESPLDQISNDGIREEISALSILRVCQMVDERLLVIPKGIGNGSAV